MIAIFYLNPIVILQMKTFKQKWNFQINLKENFMLTKQKANRPLSVTQYYWIVLENLKIGELNL